MANTDRTRKLIVRTAVVTSTTIATLVGAQNFAMLDARDFQLTETATAPIDNATQTSVVQTAPEMTILHTAPSISILRHSGQVNVASAHTAAVQPPSPSQITVPQPVVVQHSIVQRTRSSR